MERARGQEEQEEPTEQQDAGKNGQSAPLFSWKELSLWQKAAVLLAGIGAGFLIFWLVMYLLEKKSRPQDAKMQFQNCSYNGIRTLHSGVMPERKSGENPAQTLCCDGNEQDNRPLEEVLREGVPSRIESLSQNTNNRVDCL